MHFPIKFTSNQVLNFCKMKRTKQRTPKKNANSTKQKKEDEITFRFDDDNITCSKSLLLEHSDYFKVLLDGDFVEKNKKIIYLKGVTARTMSDLIGILQERELFNKCEDTYAVLEACGMFLFDGLKTWILTELERGLDLTNCLQMWHELERLGLSPLCWHAKSMSLLNFQEILENDSIDCLNFYELYYYLGNVNLQCDKETYVFDAALRWFRKHDPDDPKLNLTKLLNCIDFKHAKLRDVIEMKESLIPDGPSDVLKILNYVIQIKSELVRSVNDECYECARRLMQSKRRFHAELPCFLKKNAARPPEDTEDSQLVIFYDKYKRKRRRTVVRDNSRERLVYYDHATDSLREFSHLPDNTCTNNLSGYGMLGHKRNIFVFGGEFSMGKGTWNFNTWQFDYLLGKLEQKQSMPFSRRHFESCICGDYLFVVGGTGLFRVIQDDMFSYNLKTGKWRKEDALPCSGKQVKCCNYNGGLFVFSFSDKCGFIFEYETKLWKKICINDARSEIPKTFTLFTIFFHKGYLYLKGDKLIQLALSDDTFEVTEVTTLPMRDYAIFYESVTSHNYCYTLWKCEVGTNGTGMLLEYLDLDTLKINYTHADISGVEKMFLLHHYSLVIENTFVN